MGTTEALDLQAAADELGVHYQTAYRWVREKRLPATRVRGRYQLSAADVDAFAAERDAPAPPAPTSIRRDWDQHAERVFNLLRAGDERSVTELITRLHRQDTPVLTLLSEVLVPALRRVGDEWRAGELSIAQEHRASAIVERVLAAIDRRGPGRPRGLVVVAAPAGDMHALPAAMAAAALREDGWNVESLGRDMPGGALVDFVADLGPDLVVLTVTNPGAAEAASATADAVEAAGVPALVGGPGKALDELLAAARSTLERSRVS